MKKLTYIILGLIITVAVQSCSYKDLSTDPDKEIVEVVIDTVGVPLEHVVNFGEIFTLAPKVSYSDGSALDLSYEWTVSLFSNTSLMIMDESNKVIGREKDLNWEVDLIPDASPYQLRYRVIDNKNGQLTQIMWHLQVSASSGQGLIVAHSSNGTTSDLSLIQDPVFTDSMEETDAAVIKRNLYTAQNNAELNGIIKGMYFQQHYYMKRLTNYLFGYSSNNIYRINTLDYSLFAQGHGMMYDPVASFDVGKMWSATAMYYGPMILLNNGGFYQCRATQAYYSTEYKFSIPSPGSRAAATYAGAVVKYDPYDMISVGTSEFMFFDKVGQRFMRYSNSYSIKQEPLLAAYAEGDVFNPTSLEGYVPLGAGPGSNANHCFIMRKGDEYVIASMNQDKGKARDWRDISDAPDIAKARGFVVCDNQPVIFYYTTEGKIYSILFDDGAATSYSLQFTSAEPINGIYLLKQANKELEMTGAAIIVTTTTDQTEGKVLLIPMGTIGMGDLAVTAMKQFGGFSRISAVTIVD